MKAVTTEKEIKIYHNDILQLIVSPGDGVVMLLQNKGDDIGIDIRPEMVGALTKALHEVSMNVIENQDDD